MITKNKRKKEKEWHLKQKGTRTKKEHIKGHTLMNIFHTHNLSSTVIRKDKYTCISSDIP